LWENWTPNYLTSYTETDPVFAASPAGGITNANIGNWNTAFSWGNHAAAGYLTGITSEDLGDLNDVSTAGAVSGDVLKYNGTSWAPATDATGGGSGGATVPTQDAAPINPIDGDLWWKSDDGVLKVYYDDGNTTQWVDASPAGSGGATVSTSDTAPSSPTDGDLWWKSDEGRLKVYYQDADSSQWVDAAPTVPTTVSNIENNGNQVAVTGATSGDSIEFSTNNGTATAVRWRITSQGSLIPAVNDAYDIGSAEYKVRDLYVNDGSIHTESGNALSFYNGNLTWGGDDVIMLQDLKEMMMNATSFEDFKNSIMSL
jgi:hypothetical protein